MLNLKKTITKQVYKEQYFWDKVFNVLQNNNY